MCGIAGFFRPAGVDDDASPQLERMLGVLGHRGPDGKGQHVDAALGLAMGHRRLSVIDLSETGRQPLKDPARSLVLTVNGEFYDFKAMRAALAADGERFATKSDSELALKLYARHGLAFVEHLRGEFAIALFDASRRRLVLARDRFGVRPLFYHLGPNAIYYASEAKALLEHPAVPKRLDLHGALHQMMHTLVPGSSAFEGIQALLPGHLLVIEARGSALEVTRRRYWDFDWPKAGEHEPEPEPRRHVLSLRDALVDAVRVRLEADVPVGCYLSGGIDSCSILGLATAMQQAPVRAFTIGFDHAAYDETDIASEMARSVNAEQDILRLSAAELYGEGYTRTLWHAERTFYNTLGVAKWCMSRRVRERGLKVVVTGEGSDELFAGYPFLKQDYYLHAPEVTAEERARAGVQNALFTGALLTERPVRHAAFEDLCGFTPAWIQPWMLVLERVRPLLSTKASEALADYDPVGAIAAALDPAQLRDRHPLDKAQYTWTKTMLECQILNWGGDRVDMAHSVESRPPFLDHHLAAVARRIPPWLRIRRGVEKWALREAVRGVLPEVLYRREKFAFMAPPAATDERKRQGLRALVDARLKPEQVDALGLFDQKRLEAFVDAYFAEQDPVVARRSDSIMNHLLGLHVIHQDLLGGTTRAGFGS